MLEYRALGGLTVVDGGVELSLGGSRQRRLAAVLLIDRNRVVSVDRLGDVVFATAVATTALLAGVLGVLGSLVAGRAILPGNGFTRANGYEPLSLADGPTLRAVGGTVLYLALVALLSLGVATAVRGTAGAITGVLTLLYAFPIVAQLVSDPRWQQRLERYGPMEAGLSVQHTTRLDELPIGPWPGLGVLATYAGFALLSGLTLFQLRDA
jgi:ABC-2 type transport system permease protein